MKLTLSNREKRWGWLFLVLQMFLVPNACAALCVLLGIPSGTVANVLAFFCNALLAPVFFRDLLRRSLEHFRWKNAVFTVLKGLALYWLLNFLYAGMLLLLKPDFANINDPTIHAMLDEAPVSMSLAVILLAPLAEECLFRGWIFTGLAERSVPLAYGVTMTFFSAAHIAGYVGAFDAPTLALCFVQYLGPSFVLCRACRKTDSLLPPLLLHMTINTITLLITR